MSETSAGALLALVRSGRAATRTDLGHQTGLSRTAVSSRVSSLLDAGLLVEAGELASTGGRPAGALVFHAEAASVVGVAVGRSRSQIGVFDLEGAVQETESHDHEVGSGPDEVMPHLAERLTTMLEGRSRPVLGLGLSLPGTVDPERRVSLDSPVMRGWDGVPLPPFFADVTGAPVYLTNDTAALARSELLGHAPARNALVVKASTGLGLGLVADGRLVGSDRGVIGELGHTRVAEAGDRLCRCGATGCLETVAGGWALTQELQESGLPVRHVRDVVSLALEGNPAARNALRQSGRQVGEVLAVAVTLLNPETVVVGGDMGRAFDLWSAGVRESVYGLSTASSTRDLTFRPAAHGDLAGLVGCAATVIDHELAPEAVDSRLRTRA
ncbi:ROK family transcriptional regulator [Nocardioides aestuarii]|uniref:ROK family protein n=1 Tax=Nocardioides aestuarii TaxID=252231 RepID=A0ABW4TP04_9ACTN